MQTKLEMTFNLPEESEAFEAIYNGPSYLIALRKIKKEIFDGAVTHEEDRALARVQRRFNEIVEEVGVIL